MQKNLLKKDQSFRCEIELLDGASADFDMELVTKGELSPVFFGSALTNFGAYVILRKCCKNVSTLDGAPTLSVSEARKQLRERM